MSESRKHVGRLAQCLPADRDVIGVNFLAIVAYQRPGLRCLALLLRAEALSRAAVSYSAAAVAHKGRSGRNPACASRAERV
jgi:hypothetical protein